MSQKEVTIVGKNNTKVGVTGQNELLVKVQSIDSGAGLATETTLALVNTKLTTTQKTPAMSRTSASGTVTAGKFSVSVANVGSANGTLLGATLEPGESVNIDAGALNNTLAAIAYNATGTEFLIITLS